ncbi:MAG TPA: MFS transporter [Chlamydiales bacterium]|nr:MFS transporter [Chlamydiales bacterium]
MGILLLLISFGSIAAIILTPALPELSREFDISPSQAQLAMSVFLVGYALGMLPYGPIANRFGRKKAIWIGVGLTLIGSLLAIVAPLFWILVVARFVQALGSAVGLKITFTMISDQHEGKVATRAISLLSFAFALMPALGAAVGGYLVTHWGWMGCFYFIFAYGLLLGLLTFALPETSKQRNPEALQVGKIARGYLRQFSCNATVLNGLLMGTISASFYTFATLAPYIGIETLGLSPEQYGFWNLTLCIGLILGIAFTRWSAAKEKTRFATFIAILLMGLGSIVMLISFLFSWITIWTLFVSAILMRIGSNAIWVNASMDGLSASHDKSNTSAVMQFLNLGTSTVALFLVGLFPTTQVLVLPITLCVIVVLLVFLRYQNLKNRAI